MRRAFALVSEVVLARYLLASVFALGVDVGAFLLLLAIGAAATPASAAGYALGIVAHWLFSSRTVFVDGVAARGPARNRQKAMFVASALLGLLLTTMVVAGGTAAGTDPRLAKLVAIALSFAVTWLLRSRVIFRWQKPAPC